MAAALERNSSVIQWFCHYCNSEIVPDLLNYKCPICANGFIEPIEEEISSNGPATESNEEEDIESLPIVNPMIPPESVTSADSPLRYSVPTPFGFTNAPHFAPPNPFDGFHGFVEQLLFGLVGGLNTGAATVNIQMGPQMLNGNTGDYVFSTEGLDNIVTMLMNQLEGTGSPPAAKEHVDALPSVAVRQAQVDDKLQCHVCMENFHLDEKVKELPCCHVYHGDCIEPWLQLHGTCPVCRKRIDVNAAANPNSRFHSDEGRA